MTQADSVHSTPPTNTSATNPLDQARRHFLTVAAGGALAAVAITTAAQAAGSPADPIFAVIEAHRKAQAVAEAAFAESSRLLRLADEVAGPSNIEIPNMVDPESTVMAQCWWDVERVIPRERYPALNDHYCKLLSERKSARQEIYGDPDQLTNGPAGAASNAHDQFIKTMPTTLPGLLAMIVMSTNSQRRIRTYSA